MGLLKKKVKIPPPEAISKPFPVVGVGASAGGLEAFKRLLKAIPEKSGMAYVLVQHLNPSHESILPEILSRATNIPIHEITDDIKLAPDNIYVIPSNKILTAVDGKLSLTPRDESKLNHSIDIFFTSLAEVHQGFAIGIVLSGTGSDGSLGLKTIKEFGGVTFAQEGHTAAYEGMPQSAMDTGMVDFILPPEDIPAQLMQIGSIPKASNLHSEDEELTRDDQQCFDQILTVLRQKSGIDFTYYKQATIGRRIARRMMLRKKEKLADYLKFLRSDQEEQGLLFMDVLIPVTSFFRDPKTFHVIKETVLPALYKKRSDSEPIRIWVAGCSTGEEAFSIAICLHEFLGDKFSVNRIQIFATDISEAAITKARRGVYSKTDVSSLTEEQLRNYFTKVNASYQVNKNIRDVCVFAVHNLLKDPPFARMDMVSCRNVLIYMDNFLQKKALNTFHYALRENGFLLLGKSETTGPGSELFAVFSRYEKIYSRKPVQGRFIPADMEHKKVPASEKNKPPPLQAPDTDFRKKAESILISRFTPPAVIVNDQMDIVHIHGIIADFLEPSPGKPTFNLIKMAREGLGFELRNILHKAKESKETAVKEHIPVKKDGKQYTVSIEVIPLKNTVEPHYLVMFHKIAVMFASPQKKTGIPAGSQIKLDDALQQIDQLEGELAQTREDMRSITEDQEAVNEELQSANEELLSSGEELQSLNEELETSKEELQSTNEELTVVNHELTDKQEQLSEALAYSAGIIATIREPFIILDKALRIKSANSSFYKKFNINAHETEGKLFYELQNRQWDNNILRNLLEKILPEKTEINDFEITLEFPSAGERTMLMNAKQVISENTGKLILLSIEDITERKKSEIKIEESEKQFRQLAETIPLMVWTATPGGKTNYCNSYLLNSTGLLFDELKDDYWHKHISPIDQEKTVKKWDDAVKEEKVFVNENRIRNYNGDYCWHKTKAIPRKDSNGRITGWVGISIEIEEEKIKEMRKDDFINIASHELKTPITSLKGYVEIMHDIFTTANDPISLQLSDKVRKQVEKLINLVNNLYDVTQIKEDQVRINKSNFDIDALISEVGDAMQAASKRHLIVMDLQANKTISADRARIEQVITNLISNAIKYSQQADKVLVTSVFGEGMITVCVQDFGIGLSEKMRANIFNRYFRGDIENVHNSPGLGLGLYIVAEIIKLHGGTISVSSEMNKGSTFCFSIPV